MKFSLGISLLGSCVAAGNVLLKPPVDYRKFHFYKLKNGIRGLAIYHPGLSHSGFAVGINSGSLRDPREIPGLAHYIEHMLFLGTRKEPNESGFDIFMAEHGGTNNAYTGEDHMVFFNQVEKEALSDALARFSEFFKEPTLDKAWAEREAHAIAAEHSKNVPVEQERVFAVFRDMAQGPANHFSTGNFNTLWKDLKKKGIDVIEQLRTYFDANFCGLNMVVVTETPDNVIMQEATVRRNFDGVVASRVSNSYQCPPSDRLDLKDIIPEQHKGVFVTVASSTPESSLWIMFSAKSLADSYNEQPFSHLNYIFGYSGPQSLSDRLKMLGLATEIQVPAIQSGAGSLYGLEVELTSQGRSHVAHVLREVFAYIALAREAGIGKAQAESLKNQSYVDFAVREPSSHPMENTERLATNMLKYKEADILSGDSLIRTQHLRTTTRLLKQMKPENAIILQTVDNYKENESTNTEKYYGVKYDIRQLPKHLLHDLSDKGEKSAQYLLPPPLKNVIELSTLKLLRLSTDQPPTLLVNSEFGEYWWYSHSRLPVPKIAIQLHARIPRDMSSAATTARGTLYSLLVSDLLQDEMVDYRECGAAVDFSFVGDGFSVTVFGYSPEQLQSVIGLVKKSVNAISHISSARFNGLRQTTMATLNSSSSRLAYQLAIEAAAALTVSDVYPRKTVAAQAASSTCSSTALFANHSMGHILSVYITALAAGNVDKAAAVELLRELVSACRFHPLKKEDAALPRVSVLQKPTEIHISNPIVGDKNHATLVSYQLGNPSIADTVNMNLIANIFNRQIFDSLRTHHQLGYIVGARAPQQFSVQSLVAIVEGSQRIPAHVVPLIDEELRLLREHIDEMSQPEFGHWKRSIASDMVEARMTFVENLGEKWTQLRNWNRCFDAKDKALDYLKSPQANNKTLVALLDRLVRPPHRLVVAVTANPQEPHASRPFSNDARLVTEDNFLQAKRQLATVQWPTQVSCTV